MNRKQVKVAGNSGFSLIELMISVAIGLFLMAGVFTVYVNSSATQRQVQDQIALLDNARFALDAISYDLRQAGLFGRRSLKDDNVFNNSAITGIDGECATGWASDISIQPVRAFNDDSPYKATCTPLWSKGDVIEMRYTLGTPVTTLFPKTLYLNGDINQSQFFIGATSPDISPSALDFQVVARAYYISSYTDVVGDGIPSLHRVSLQTGTSAATGPVVVDTMLLPGVIDLQIQFGIDVGSTKDFNIDMYVNPETTLLAENFPLFAQIWVVLESTNKTPDLDTDVTFNIAGSPAAYTDNDGYRKVMLSTVVDMRNLVKSKY